MARHNDLGWQGEELAAEWLTEKGFSILHRNWRHRRSEVDIIAARDDVYHFVEVKCGSGTLHGYPEERVSKDKLLRMMKGAAHWLYIHKVPAIHRVQYDVLAIWFKDPGLVNPEYRLFEDVSL